MYFFWTNFSLFRIKYNYWFQWLTIIYTYTRFAYSINNLSNVLTDGHSLIIHCICIENEFHVSFKCPKFNEEMKMYIFSWCNGEQNFQNVCNLMHISDERKLKSIAFLYPQHYSGVYIVFALSVGWLVCLVQL